METETPTIKATNEAIGIDLGIVNPATDNRGNFYGSKHWKNIEDKIFQLRRRLQKKAHRPRRGLLGLGSEQARHDRRPKHI